MNKKKLVKLLKSNGWYLLRHGANHDVYTNGEKTEAIPRHNDIKENLAKSIIKRHGLE